MTQPNLRAIAATNTVKMSPFGVPYMAGNELLYNYGPFSTWKITSGSTLQSEYVFFQSAQGNNGGQGFATSYRLTYNETNMRAKGKLTAGNQATVKRIYVTVTPVGQGALSSATNEWIKAFMQDSVLGVKVNDAEVMGDRALTEFGGYGISGYLDQTNPADISLGASEPSSVARAFNLSAPFGIPSDTRFKATLTPNSNNTFISTVPEGADIRVCVYFIGNVTQTAVL